MTCHEWREMTAALLEGALDANAKAAVESHIESCEACRAEFDQARRVRERLLAGGRAFAGGSLDARVMETISKRAMRPRRVNVIYTYAKRLGPLAAAAVILVTAGVFMLWDRPSTRAFALEESIAAAKNVKTMHVVEQVPLEALRKEVPSEGPNEWAVKAWADFHESGPLVTRAEFWAQFDDSGKLLHLRMEFAVTEDGHKIVFWDPAKIEVWFKTKNGLLITSQDLLKDDFTQAFFDPKLALKDLDAKVAAGEASMTPEPSSSGQPSRFKVVYGERADIYQIYTIDPASKLLQSVEIYSTSGGKVELVGIKRFTDYNKAMDSALWEPNVPNDTTIVNQLTQTIGLAKGNMTDQEVAKEVARQFFQALIDKDYAKAGQLYGGIPGDKLKAAFAAVTWLRIISVGEPVLAPENGPSAYKVPCQVELESSGNRGIQDCTPRIRPVENHPDRWSIIGGI